MFYPSNIWYLSKTNRPSDAAWKVLQSASWWLLLHTVRQKVTEKVEGVFWAPLDSDAVFHEESEYAIGLMIWLRNDDVSLVFRYHLKFFHCKKTQKMTKVGNSISTVYQ